MSAPTLHKTGVGQAPSTPKAPSLALPLIFSFLGAAIASGKAKKQGLPTGKYWGAAAASIVIWLVLSMVAVFALASAVAPKVSPSQADSIGAQVLGPVGGNQAAAVAVVPAVQLPSSANPKVAPFDARLLDWETGVNHYGLPVHVDTMTFNPSLNGPAVKAEIAVVNAYIHDLPGNDPAIAGNGYAGQAWIADGVLRGPSAALYPKTAADGSLQVGFIGAGSSFITAMNEAYWSGPVTLAGDSQPSYHIVKLTDYYSPSGQVHYLAEVCGIDPVDCSSGPTS